MTHEDRSRGLILTDDFIEDVTEAVMLKGKQESISATNLANLGKCPRLVLQKQRVTPKLAAAGIAEHEKTERLWIV